MGIEKFYKQQFTLYRVTTQKVDGVIETIETSQGTFMGIIDPKNTTRIYDSAKDTFIIVNKIFCSTTLEKKIGDIITYGSERYEVIDPANPLSMGHHYEIIVRRRV